MTSQAPAELSAEAYAKPRVVAPLARFLLSIFFRDIEVIGAEALPERRPLVLVANHVNALIDPALLVGFLPVRPRFLAKSTLWGLAIVRPFLALAAAIPVYRRQDPGVDPAKNAETFARCHEVLAAGGTIAIFPEGRSHNEPALVELKTGVSRIVLEAEAKFGGLASRIVPIGLVFDDKGRFRSRALVLVGEPLDPESELADYEDDPTAAVRRLTARVRAGLGEVTLNFPSWDEARLIEHAAEIWARPTSALPAEAPLAERFRRQRTFIAGYRALLEAEPERVVAVREAVRDYDERLAGVGLKDAQVASRYPPSAVLRFTVKSLWLLLVRAPLAAVGTVLHAVPYFAARGIARRWGRTADQLATYKLFASLVFYPLVWAATAAAVGSRWGWKAALAALVAAPLTGWVSLRFHERQGHFRRQARAFLLLRGSRPSIDELRYLREEVRRAVSELVELYQRP